MNKIEAVVKNLGGVISRNSPHILTGLGCAGLVSTAILTGRATPTAIELIEDEQQYRKKNGFADVTIMDKFKLTWKCYIPAGIVGLTSIGCIIGANTISTKRNTALAALYTISETAFRDYKTQVVKQLGKAKDTAIKDGVAKEYIEKNPIDESKIVITGGGDILCLDKLSGRPFTSSHETIRQKINDLNYELMSELWLDLNEYYYAIGLDPIPLGENVGFNLEKGKIEPFYSTQLDKNGKVYLIVDMDVYPKYGPGGFYR